MQSGNSGLNGVDHVVAYPFWAVSYEDKRRFDLSVAIAREITGKPAESAAVWAASRVIFGSDWPT
jgi:hypothetical protein